MSTRIHQKGTTFFFTSSDMETDSGFCIYDYLSRFIPEDSDTSPVFVFKGVRGSYNIVFTRRQCTIQKDHMRTTYHRVDMRRV